MKLSPGPLTATLRRLAESLTITITHAAISELKPLAAEMPRVSTGCGPARAAARR